MAQELVLEDTPHGLQVYYDGRRLYGQRPAEDAARRVTARIIASGSLVIWPSPVVWHGWRELSERVDDQSLVIAIESDPVLFELARRHLPADDSRLLLIRATPEGAVKALRRLGEHRLRRVVEISTTGSALLHRDTYRLIARIVEREIRVFWQNRMTLSALGRLWVRNAIANLPELIPGRPTPQLPGPAIVCGAGPSFDASIDVIRRVRKLVSLVAVDTALPVLAGHDIVPDVVVALEGQIANLHDFLGAGRSTYHLIADLTSTPVVPRRHERVSWTVTRFAPFSLIDRLAMLLGSDAPLPPLGSVGVAAVSLAAAMGASPIICTGLDFAVLPGTTHARGAPSYRTAMGRSDRLHPVPDPALGARMITAPGAGGQVLTTLVLKGYADELAAIVGLRDDIYAAAPFGLPYGARPVAPHDVASLVARAGGPRLDAVDSPADSSRRPSNAELRRFVRNEIADLQRYVSSISRQSDGELPPSLDYLMCETPDRITSFAGNVATLPPDEGARRRLHVAAEYYKERWETALRLLERRSR